MEAKARQYNDPFKHIVIDETRLYVDDKSLKECLDDVGSRLWVKYDNALEKKFACNLLNAMNPPFLGLFDLLLSDNFISGIAKQFWPDMPELKADQSLHGGGVHVYPPNGFLAPHIDYALHPHIEGMERRLNAILFLNDVPKSKGGAFCLYDDTGKKIVARVQPKRGRVVLWEPTDTAFHGCEKVRGGVSRCSIAVYYLAKARPTANRKMALFLPPRG